MNKEDIELDILQILNDFRTDGRRAMDVAADIMNVFEFHAKPLPEPVGYYNPEHFDSLKMESTRIWKEPGCNGISAPLYAEPPARKPLTDERITEIANSVKSNIADGIYTYLNEFARAIERALYTSAPEQKPLSDDDWLEINGNTNGYYGTVVLFSSNGDYCIHHSVLVSAEESINKIKDEKSKCYLSTLELGYTHWKPLNKPQSNAI